MKRVLVATTLALAAVTAFAQSLDGTASANSSASTQSGAMAVGGGLANATNASKNTNRNVARGGNGGNAAGGSGVSNVTVNLGSTDPSGTSGTGTNTGAVARDQAAGTGADPYTTTTNLNEHIKTVGNPGSVSYGVSFSQYNCANTAAAGVGFMGGVVQLGGGLESAPCNARANASAFFQIAQTLSATNPALSAQLFHAAILLIGNSTKDTQAALQAAGVSDWAAVQQQLATPPAPAIIPPASVPESKVTPAPAVATTLPSQTNVSTMPMGNVTPLPVQPEKVAEPIATDTAQPIPLTPEPATQQTKLVSPDSATPEDIERIKREMFSKPADKPATTTAPTNTGDSADDGKTKVSLK